MAAVVEIRYTGAYEMIAQVATTIWERYDMDTGC